MKPNKTIFAASLFAMAISAQAQINLPTLSYSQDFDGLGTGSGTWIDNSSIGGGWYASVSNATTGSVGPYTTAYSSGTGGTSSSSTLMSYGVTSTSERALGGSPSSTAIGMLGMRLVNNSGVPYTGIQIQFDLEQWSDRGTANVNMSYQIFSFGGGNLGTLSGWNSLLTVSSPLPVTSGTALNGLGNTTGLLAGNIGSASSITWNNGDELWVKWTITKIAAITGSNPPTGIDNVIVSVVPEPSTIALAGLGLLLFCNRMRRGR